MKSTEVQVVLADGRRDADGDILDPAGVTIPPELAARGVRVEHGRLVGNLPDGRIANDPVWVSRIFEEPPDEPVIR